MDRVERFHLLMACDVNSCGEIVSVVGWSGPEPDWDDEFGNVLITTFMPTAIYPAPKMIEVPDNIPPSAKVELQKSFQVSWMDTNSAANRLRVSIEFILDGLAIPREVLSV